MPTLPTAIPSDLAAAAQAAQADVAAVLTGKALVDDLNAKLAAATANETALIAKAATSSRTMLDGFDAWAASTRQQLQDFANGIEPTPPVVVPPAVVPSEPVPPVTPEPAPAVVPNETPTP